MSQSPDPQDRDDDEAGPLSGPAKPVTILLLAAMPLVGIVYALHLPAYLGYPLWPQQAALALLGLGLAAGFLSRDIRGRRHGARGPALLDWLFALVILVICFGAAIDYEELVAIGYLGDGAQYWVNLIASGVAVLLLVEGVRRFAGWPMMLLVLAFILYGLFPDSLPPPLRGQRMNADFLTAYIFLDPSGILGTALGVVVTTVIAYVLLGSALFRFGGGQLFLDLSLASMGRYRGGSAKAAVVASSLFGTVSGSAVANVMTTGIVTIPLMKASGFARTRAGAVEAVASTGGQLLPPVMGAAAFIMAEFLNLPYAEVALAALLPALLFYFAVFVQIHLYAARAGLRPLTRDERPKMGVTLRRFWMFLIPIALLIYLLFVARWQPELAAFAATIATVAAGGVYDWRNLRPSVLLDVLVSTGRSLIEIVVVTAVAGVIIGVLAITGLSFSLGMAIVDLSGGSTMLLLVLTGLAAIVFGMGMPTTAVYIVMATLIAPALVQGGIVPIAAHLYLLYFGVLSMITPPVCLASFAAASLARAPFMATGWQSVKLGAVALLVPFLFVASPALLLQGDSLLETGLALATGIAGCILLGAGIEGYLRGPLSAGLRVLSALAGVALLLPDGASVDAPWAGWSDPFGALLAVVVVAIVALRPSPTAAPLGAPEESPAE